METYNEEPFEDLDAVLSAIAHALVAKGKTRDASAFSKAEITLEYLHHDNWDGGTSVWFLCIGIPFPNYIAYSDKEREELESFISDVIKPFLPDIGHWVNPKIKPLKFKDDNWRNNVPRETDEKRRASVIHIKSLIEDIDESEQEYEITRWQSRVKIFLEETQGQEVANKFQSLSNTGNAWDDAAQQKGYLESLLLKIEHEYNEQSIEKIADSKFWIPSHFRLFLSHLSSFKEKTAQLQKSLREYGISSFVAHEDIEPTKEWQREIENALQSMDALCAILMPKFNESKWTDQEIGVAVGRDVLIIPIRKGMNPYGFIGKYQGLQGEGKKIGEVSESIFKIISDHPKTKEKLAGILVDQIILANSIDEATKKLKLIKKFKSLSQVHLEKIRDNCANNTILINSTEFVDLLNGILDELKMSRLTHKKSYESTSNDEIPF